MRDRPGRHRTLGVPASRDGARREREPRVRDVVLRQSRNVLPDARVRRVLHPRGPPASVESLSARRYSLPRDASPGGVLPPEPAVPLPEHRSGDAPRRRGTRSAGGLDGRPVRPARARRLAHGVPGGRHHIHGQLPRPLGFRRAKPALLHPLDPAPVPRRRSGHPHPRAPLVSRDRRRHRLSAAHQQPAGAQLRVLRPPPLRARLRIERLAGPRRAPPGALEPDLADPWRAAGPSDRRPPGASLAGNVSSLHQASRRPHPATG